jgi:type VI secretion system protein ImpK
MRTAPVGPHPQMAAMYWAFADLFAMVTGLAHAGGSLPPASQLRQMIDTQLSTMMTRGRDAGILREDLVDAQYAIVALIDETLARTHGWAGQAEWRQMPLQLLRYNENTAGELFFWRLTKLEEQPHRVHVLQVYFLCMAIGFQGRYSFLPGAGLAEIYERVGARIAEATGPDVISPHGEAREHRGLFQLEAPLVRIGLGMFGFALLLFLLLRVILSLQVRETTKPMQEFAGTVNAGAKR